MTIYQDIAAGRARAVGLTVDVYDHLIDNGLIAEDTTTELIDGVIVTKDRSAVGEDPMPVGDRHRVSVIRLGRYDGQFRPLGCYLQTQQPIVLPPDNEPEPDGAVIRGSEDDATGKPRAADVLAVIEVADCSLGRDLGPKLRGYAAAGIPQYVVTDLEHDRVLVHSVRPPREPTAKSWNSGAATRCDLQPAPGRSTCRSSACCPDRRPRTDARSRLRPVHSEELPSHARRRGDRLFDLLGLPKEVGVKCTEDDPVVVGVLMVQAEEITAVQRQGDATFSYGEGQDQIVRDFLPGPACFTGGEDVVPHFAEPGDDGLREVFVRVQSHRA